VVKRIFKLLSGGILPFFLSDLATLQDGDCFFVSFLNETWSFIRTQACQHYFMWSSGMGC
jgi:hypothetical protein